MAEVPGMYFYWGSIRRYILSFGDLFNEIYVHRMNADGSLNQSIRVPISFSPRHKFLAKYIESIQTTTDSSVKVQTTLPRLSYEMDAPELDAERMKNRKNSHVLKDDLNNQLKTILSPTPYNFPVRLNLWSKNLSDGYMILEQILARFSPEVNMTIIDIPELKLCSSVPVILDSVEQTDEYEGDLGEDFRLIQWTLSFTLKGWLYPNFIEGGIIKRANVLFRKYVTGHILEKLTVAVVPKTANPDDEHTIVSSTIVAEEQPNGVIAEDLTYTDEW